MAPEGTRYAGGESRAPAVGERPSGSAGRASRRAPRSCPTASRGRSGPQQDRPLARERERRPRAFAGWRRRSRTRLQRRRRGASPEGPAGHSGDWSRERCPGRRGRKEVAIRPDPRLFLRRRRRRTDRRVPPRSVPARGFARARSCSRRGATSGRRSSPCRKCREGPARGALDAHRALARRASPSARHASTARSHV